MNSRQALVSVIMNCYNGSEYLREALDSIYAQTYREWEIIFWDNASTDDSGAIARSYDERLRYFRNETNVPLGSARNAALAKVRGEFIAFLDTDDRWLPGKLERQAALLKNNPRLGLVHSDLIMLDQDTGLTTRYFSMIGIHPPRGKIFGNLLTQSFIGMPAVMLRTAALHQQSEWFDERFEIYTDFDLFRRIAHDWECDYVDEPLAIYRVHRQSSSARNHARSADELAMTLEKFISIYPGFAAIYSGETIVLRTMIAYQRGKSLWRDGDGRGARAEFLRYWKSPKMLLATVSTILPYHFAESIRRMLLRSVLRR